MPHIPAHAIMRGMSRRTRVPLGLVLLPLWAAAWAPHDTLHAQDGNRIRIEATGFRSDDGNLRCSLHDEAAAFPTHPERALAGAMSRIVGRTGACTFDDIPPGRYAISLHHDADGDGTVDTGLFGIPTEGLGSSNDARGSMGPPSFEAAAFTYTGGNVTLRASIGYVF